MTSFLGDINYKNRVLKSCLEHVSNGGDKYISTLVHDCYFHPGGVNYCILQRKKGDYYR